MFSRIDLSCLHDFLTIGANWRQAYWLLLKVYPTYSLKRKIAFFLHFLLHPFIKQTRDRTVELEGWVKQRPQYQKSSIFAVLLHKETQNGRIYIFEFGKDCAPVSFTKLTRDAAPNLRIEREVEALNSLAGRTVLFRTPRILSFMREGTCIELCVEAAAPDFVIHSKTAGLPMALFQEIAGLGNSEPNTIRSVHDTRWFRSASESVVSERIKKIIDSIPPERSFAVCAAHCDLGSENVLSRPGANDGGMEYLILDWEYFTDQAPVLTDRVSYWLGQRHRALKRSFPRPRPDAVLVQLIAEFEKRGYEAQEVAIALLYLVHIGHDLSAKVCGVQNDRL